jgi:hypothetical protein
MLSVLTTDMRSGRKELKDIQVEHIVVVQQFYKTLPKGLQKKYTQKQIHYFVFFGFTFLMYLFSKMYSINPFIIIRSYVYLRYGKVEKKDIEVEGYDENKINKKSELYYQKLREKKTSKYAYEDLVDIINNKKE